MGRINGIARFTLAISYEDNRPFTQQRNLVLMRFRAKSSLFQLDFPYKTKYTYLVDFGKIYSKSN